MEDTNGHVVNVLRKKGKVKKSRVALEHEVEHTSPDVSQTPFIRALGSTDFNTRAKGVQALTRFLQLKTELAEEDLLKIWKGLYVCFWHSDKAPVQEDLADRLVSIFPALNQRMAFLYFTVFIKTMQREWFNIDRLRLDKFLMLVRKFMGQLFTYLGSHNWDPHLLEQYTDFLRDHLLLPLNPHHAIGLAYHMCDIFVPELRAALAANPTHNTHSSQQQQHQEQQEHQSAVGVGKKRGRQVMQEQQQQEATGAVGLPAAALEALLEPFSSTLLRAEEQAMLTRVREAVFDPLIEELLAEDVGQEEEMSDEDEGREGQNGGGKQRSVPLLVLAGGEGLGASFAAQLSEMGGMSEVKARNRTVLFGISQSLEKAQRKRAKRMLPDTATLPSLASPTVSLPRHQQQQQQQELRAQEQQQQKQQQQQQQQQQQEQQKGPASSMKKGKKDKALVFVTDSEEQQVKQQQQQQQQQQEEEEEQDGLDSARHQPEPSLASPPTAVSPKTLKKQRKAEAAAAAAAAWGEGGIGARSTQASSASTPGTSAPGSAKKQGKKGRVGQAGSAPATAESTPVAESTPTSSPAVAASPKSLKKVSIPIAASTPAAHAASMPAAAAAAPAAGAGDFAFSAAGPSGRDVSGGSSPSTPTLGKSAMKKDKKRKAEGADDDAADLWGGMDSIDGLVELASVSKSALRSTGAKGRVSIPSGVDDGDGSQQQQPVLRSSGKKHKKQLQQGLDAEALGSPQEVLLQPSAPKSALKSALKQQGTPTLKSALKHKGPSAESAADGISDGVDLAAAGREALRTAMRHRSFAADDVEVKSSSRSALRANGTAPHTPGAPEASVPSFTNALQVHLTQDADATPTPMPSPGVGKRTHMQQQQQQSQAAASTPLGVGPPAYEPQGTEKSSSGKKRKAAAAAGGPATSARKAVRINLRNNLVFKHGDPIPDPMVRTPPTARSKGSILKRAQESLAAMGIPSSPKSAPAKLQKQQQLQARQQQSGSTGKSKQPKSAHVTPIKSPRAKAELFF